MEKHIDLMEGDTLLVRSVPRNVPTPPPKPDVPPTGGEDLHVLIEIPPVTIFANAEGTYVHYVSDLDVCSDGSGSSHGDQYHQSMTAYCSGGKTGSKYMNADVDLYVVVPPQIRSMVDPIVMGCAARVTNMQNGAAIEAVVGDIGPESKTGECGYRLAKMLNPAVTVNSGDSSRIFLYEIFPGKNATIEGFTYKLQGA